MLIHEDPDVLGRLPLHDSQQLQRSGLGSGPLCRFREHEHYNMPRDIGTLDGILTRLVLAQRLMHRVVADQGLDSGGTRTQPAYASAPQLLQAGSVRGCDAGTLHAARRRVHAALCQTLRRRQAASRHLHRKPRAHLTRMSEH